MYAECEDCVRCGASSRVEPCHKTVLPMTRAAAVLCDDAIACERRRYRLRPPSTLGRAVKRQGLFNGYWLTPSGDRIRRIRRDEYPELYRLWSRHMDIRLGVQPLGSRGRRPPLPPREQDAEEAF